MIPKSGNRFSEKIMLKQAVYNAVMRQSLNLHPDSQSLAVTRIDVTVAWPKPDHLLLSYAVAGNIGDIRMPAVTAAPRGEELWRHTCFEAFVRASTGAEYYEFNFAPSTQWAAYRFNSYRSGMGAAAEITAVPIEAQSSRDCYTLQALLELDRLSGLRRDAPWRLGLSVLIEDTEGRTSYWALAHPPGKPDFHHTDCFRYEFSPGARS
jgi:hypothetical protein